MIITGEQLRAALGAMYWTRKELADSSGVNPRTIQRIAESRGVPSSSAKTLSLIVEVFEAGDESGWIEFSNYPAPGVHFHKRRESELSG